MPNDVVKHVSFVVDLIPNIDSTPSDRSCSSVKFSCVVEALKVVKMSELVFFPPHLEKQRILEFNSEKGMPYIEHVPIWDNNFTKKYAVVCHGSYV